MDHRRTRLGHTGSLYLESAITKKTHSIQKLLDRLRADLGDETFDIVDHWEDAPDAIGLASPANHQLLAYVSTSNLTSNTYSYELELPPDKADAIYVVARRSDSCTYAELFDAIRAHWNVEQ